MEICASLPLALMHTEGSKRQVRSAFSRALEVAVMQQDLAYELRLLSVPMALLGTLASVPVALAPAVTSRLSRVRNAANVRAGLP